MCPGIGDHLGKPRPPGRTSCLHKNRCGGEGSELYGGASGGRDLRSVEFGCHHGNHKGALLLDKDGPVHAAREILTQPQLEQAAHLSGPVSSAPSLSWEVRGTGSYVPLGEQRRGCYN
ncbi:putative oxidoreductase [Dissostichus eleginoides]|uniref:Oxidoreductase n=1 Tax=Dissostichus eleginoides TaxID=100907 RepID=A0AAD9FEX0_DISEL|nr:putative oxidoreductase [Dissostichus eleginoides]